MHALAFGANLFFIVIALACDSCIHVYHGLYVGTAQLSQCSRRKKVPGACGYTMKKLDTETMGMDVEQTHWQTLVIFREALCHSSSSR